MKKTLVTILEKKKYYHYFFLIFYFILFYFIHIVTIGNLNITVIFDPTQTIVDDEDILNICKSHKKKRKNKGVKEPVILEMIKKKNKGK